MTAAVYYENGAPVVLRYEDVPEPACPPDGVLVDVEVISVEGGDTIHRARTPFADRPHIGGYQCAVAFGTAHEALFALGELTTGQRVLVHAGAGGVGLAAIQLAKAAGVEVLTTASSDEKLARLRELGATHLINYRAGAFDEAIVKLIGRDGVDLVIDSVGSKTLQESVNCLRYRGRIIRPRGPSARFFAVQPTAAT